MFNLDKFTLTSLTAAINKAPYKPGQISALGIFEEGSIPTTTAQVEIKEGVLRIVPVAPRDAPPVPKNLERRKIVTLGVPHLPANGTIMASEVQDVRAFGSEMNPLTVEAKRDEVLAAMREDIDYTIEHHRLRALHGVFVDINGDETNLATTFGVTAPSAINMALTTTSTKVRAEKCMAIVRAVQAGLNGATYSGIWAGCGENFWEKLIGHPSVEAAYANYEAAVQLRADPSLPFQFGGVNWFRYRGDSSVGINTNKARVFPSGVRGMYLTRFAPANYIDAANRPGLPYYAKAKVLDYDKGIAMEAQSNPLNIVTRPEALIELDVA